MKIAFTNRAWKEYLHWQTNDRKLLGRLNELLRECSRTPYAGLGKPEPLIGNFSGCWSRRITHEHRLIYRIEEDAVVVLQCRYHYDR